MEFLWIMNTRLFGIALLTMIVAMSTSSLVLAHPHEGNIPIDGHSHEPQNEYIPINGVIGLEKTQLTFHASENNSLPWAFVEGKIANPVVEYPIIIQIYREVITEEGKIEKEFVHFAQTNVNENGNYEYKFRVLNIDDGKTTKFFEGDYKVNIFKVVYTNSGNFV